VANSFMPDNTRPLLPNLGTQGIAVGTNCRPVNIADQQPTPGFACTAQSVFSISASGTGPGSTATVPRAMGPPRNL